MDTDTAAKPNSLFPHPSINKEEGGTRSADPPTRPGAGTSNIPGFLTNITFLCHLNLPDI